jgi:hypothetical protein
MAGFEMTKLTYLWHSALILCVALVAVGCTPIPRQRTLPASIRAVHVPMPYNRTSTPGLEERIAVAVQKEILADGRLRLVRPREADALVKITLRDFDRVGDFFDGDDFATGQRLRAEVDLEILENIPTYPVVGGVRRLLVEQNILADTRSVGYLPEPESMANFYEGFAKVIVQELITGEYTDALTTADVETAERLGVPILLPGR